MMCLEEAEVPMDGLVQKLSGNNRWSHKHATSSSFVELHSQDPGWRLHYTCFYWDYI